MEIRSGYAPKVDYGARYVRYNNSVKGKARNETRDEKRRNASLQRYLTKEFVAWDGEGGNETDGDHTYFLLANSDGITLTDRNGLSTERIFETCLSARAGVWNIIYGGNYDINCWIKDIPYEQLEKLYKEGRVRWNGYYLEWRPGKSFSIKQGKRSFLMYDVLPFFQRSFVAACDEYLGRDWPDRDNIIREKSRRGNFDWSEIESIGNYNRSELENLIRLANELRERLYKVDIRVRRWDGPGAIASSIYTKYKTKSHLGSPPSEVISAGRYAYAGGRFEIIRKGHSLGPAYQYDICSAYPSAIRFLPCLNPEHGRWVHRSITDGVIRRIAKFGVYRIEIVNPWTKSRTQPQPLWMRNKNGTVYFSEYSAGWYWSPEAELMTELGGVNIYEGWEWHGECTCEPFSFVEPLYRKRAALKKAGDGAHIGIKLGLNSLYGKLAQQIGYDPGPPLRLPPYHSLEWAGFITSHCRTQMYRAAMLCIDDVIAFETDAIFTRRPISLPLGSGLGEYEETRYQNLTYLKSGMYYGTLEDGTEVEKSRGINKGSISRQEVIDALQNPEIINLRASQTRFVGLGLAINQDMRKWRKWFTSPREISIGLNGKRMDLLDKDDIWKDLNDGWHETEEGYAETEFSYQYPVLWATETDMVASPDGLAIDELRTLQSSEVWE